MPKMQRTFSSLGNFITFTGMSLMGVLPSNMRGKTLLCVVDIPVAVTVEIPSFNVTGNSSNVAKPSSIMVLYAPVSKMTIDFAKRCILGIQIPTSTLKTYLLENY